MQQWTHSEARVEPLWEMGHRQWLVMMFSLVKLRLSSVVLGEVLRTSFLGYLKKKNLADTSA